MDKMVIVRLVVIVNILFLPHTIANLAGSRYTGSNKKSEPHYAPFDDEDNNLFSGEVGMSLSYSTFEDEIGKFDLNRSKNVEEVDQDDKTPLGRQQSYAADFYGDYGVVSDECGFLKSLGLPCKPGGDYERPTEEEAPLGLQQSYDADLYVDYGVGSDECEVLKSLGIHCETGGDYEPPTDEGAESDNEEGQTTSDTIVATLTVITEEPSVSFEDHTSATSSATTIITTNTEKAVSTTPTKTKQALATSDTIVATLKVITDKSNVPFEYYTSTTSSTAPTPTANTEKSVTTTPTKTKQPLATTIMMPSNLTIVASTIQTPTTENAVVTTKNQKNTDKNQIEVHNPTPAIAVTATSTAVGNITLYAIGIGPTMTSEKANKTRGLPSDATEDEDLDVVIPELIPVNSMTTRVTLSTNTPESMGTSESNVVAEVDSPAEEESPVRSTQNSMPKTTMGDIGTETVTDKSRSITNPAENVDTSEGNKLKTTKPAPSSTMSTMKSQKKPASDSVPSRDEDTPTTVDALKPTTAKSDTAKTVKSKDVVMPRTQVPTDRTPQPTTGTKTTAEASVVGGKEQLTEIAKADKQDDNARQPFTTPESDKANEDVKTDSIAPQKAKFSTIVLIVCIVSLLIVLILMIAIIVIVRARLKRRGKYAITSEIESTEGAPEGEAGKSDVARGGGEKVVTVQYNDSNA